jgi:hypothetical protein
MSALNLSLGVRAVPVQCICFAPFVKGGYGGFALCMIEEREQIPLDPPLIKGEKRPHCVLFPVWRTGEISMRVAA